MTSDGALTIVGERVSRQRPLSLIMLKGARLRAIGYTQEMTAAKLNVGVRTVQHWEERDDFDDAVTLIRDELRYALGPAIMANVHLAADLQRRVFIGEIRRKDERYLEAKELLAYVLPFLRPDAGARDADTQRGTAVQVNINGNHSE